LGSLGAMFGSSWVPWSRSWDQLDHHYPPLGRPGRFLESLWIHIEHVVLPWLNCYHPRCRFCCKNQWFFNDFEERTFPTVEAPEPPLSLLWTSLSSLGVPCRRLWSIWKSSWALLGPCLAPLGLLEAGLGTNLTYSTSLWALSRIPLDPY
jgi:hypothetical protein